MNGLPEGFEEVVPLPDGFEEVGATKAPSSTGMYTDANNSLVEGLSNAVGGNDAVLSMVAGLPAYIYSGYQGLGHLLTGGDPSTVGDVVRKTQEENFGFGAPKPFTEKGKLASEMISSGFEKGREIAGEYGEKSGGNLGRMNAEIAYETTLNFLPFPGAKGVSRLAKGIERPIKKPIKPVNSKLDALDKIAEERKPTVAESPADTWMQRQLAEREALDALEQSFADRRNVQGELDLRPKEMPLDENGIPVDMARSLDAQEMTNPRQVDLFDEEFRAAAERERSRELLEQQIMEAQRRAPEQDYSAQIEDAWRQREQQLKQQRLDEESLGKEQMLLDLEDRLREQAYRPDLQGQGPKTREAKRFPQSQRGALDIKEISDGFEAILDGRKVGYLKDNLPRGLAKELDENANIDIVKVDKEVRGKGVGRALYQAFHDKHEGRIAPSGKTTQDAWNVWKRNYPEKVDGFVKQEAQRLRSGASRELVLGNITDPEVRQRVATEAAFKVPSSQRGGLNVKDIGEAAKTLAAAITPNALKNADRVVVPKEPGEVVSKIPGLQKPLKNYIPEDPSPDAIISEALKEKDSGIRFNSVQSGATLTAAKTGSSIIKGIGRLFQNGTKRAELAQREIVQPVEKLFRGLNKNEIFELGEVLKKEMFQGEQFSKAELERAGFSPKQVEVYDAFREMQNKIYEAQNAALVSEGRKPLTKREAYLSSRWQGEWRVPVYEGNKLVWYIAEKSKLRAEKALEHLKKNGVDVNTKLSKVEYQGGGKNRGSIEDAYQTLLKILDPEDPRVASIKSIAEEMMANESHVALGQSKHFENKANVRGFVGDRPWKDPTSDAFEMFKEQFSYAKNALQWTELQKATKASKQILSNKELIDLQPNNLEYARQYAKNQLGFGENQYIAGLEKQLTEMTSRWLPADRRSFYDALGGAKTFFLATKLGFNLRYALSNLVQPVWTTPLHVDLSAKGFKHNPLKTFANAELDASAGFLEHYFNRGEQKMTPIGKEALKYAEANGIVNRSIYDEAQGLGRNKALETAETAASASIAGVEHYARLKAFMGFVHHLDQSGSFTDKIQMFQMAEEYTNIGMVDYRRGERPMIFEKGGLTGSALSTLQTFKFNYYNLLHYFGQQAFKGNWKPLVAFFGIQASMGGIMSMPFLQEIDDAWQTIKGWLPDSAHEPVKDFSVKKKMVETMPDWATYGGMSKLTGANMSSSFDSGNLADFSFDGLFPFISDLYKQGSAVAGFAANPNETTFAQAAYRIAPPGPIQGAVETNMIGNQNPNRLMEHDADYVRTPKQETYRKFGLRELEESKYRDQRYRQIQNEKQIKERMEKQSDKFYDAIVRRDLTEARIYAKRYVAYGGNPDNLNAIIEREAVKQRIPREVLDRMKANTIGAVQQTNRMRNATN